MWSNPIKTSQISRVCSFLHRFYLNSYVEFLHQNLNILIFKYLIFLHDHCSIFMPILCYWSTSHCNHFILTLLIFFNIQTSKHVLLHMWLLIIMNINLQTSKLYKLRYFRTAWSFCINVIFAPAIFWHACHLTCILEK